MGSDDRNFDDPKSATTFPQFVRAAAAAYGDDVALRLQGETIPDDSITFRELDSRSAALAKGLIARGVGKGTRVGFIYGNSPTFALLLAAITRAGGVAIPFSTLVKANELVRVLRQSDVSGLIVQRTLLGHDYVERLCDALPELRTTDSPDLRIPATPYLRWIVSSGEGLPRSVSDMSVLTEAAGSVSDELLRQVEAEVHETDQMIEIYTSGSMALPKGVKHSHGPVLSRVHYVRSMTPTLERGLELNSMLPMFWIGGLMMTLLPNWEIGATTLCTEGTSTNSRMAMGSVLAEDDLKAMAHHTLWALGMTETLGPYSYGDVPRVPGRPLCAPLDHVAERYELRVAVDGKPVGEGETGEIQVRGYAVTTGLHKVERSEHFEPDGFFRTGDMGVVEGKRIHFVGRNGDMIKTNSSNVSPAEVEMEMQQLEGVHSAYVVGLPDPKLGQLVVAAVVPREGVELDFADVEAKLRKRMSGYKVPKAYVAITREEVPMLPSNKVARRQIETLMTKKLNRA